MEQLKGKHTIIAEWSDGMGWRLITRQSSAAGIYEVINQRENGYDRVILSERSRAILIWWHLSKSCTRKGILLYDSPQRFLTISLNQSCKSRRKMRKKGVSIKFYKEVIGCKWMVVGVITNNQDLGFMLLLLLTLNTQSPNTSLSSRSAVPIE